MQVTAWDAVPYVSLLQAGRGWHKQTSGRACQAVTCTSCPCFNLHAAQPGLAQAACWSQHHLMSSHSLTEQHLQVEGGAVLEAAAGCQSDPARRPGVQSFPQVLGYHADGCPFGLQVLHNTLQEALREGLLALDPER